MQITIYLPEDLIKKVDTLAKRKGRSRSSVIQETLTNGLEAARGTEYPEETLSVFGAWKDLNMEQIQESRDSFAKDTRRLKLK